MNDRSSDASDPDGTPPPDDSWLERAREASVALLTLVERNPHGAFLTGLPVEPWQPAASHPLRPTG